MMIGTNDTVWAWIFIILFALLIIRTIWKIWRGKE